MRKLVLVLAFCFLFLGCGNVKDLKFGKDNQDKVMEKVAKSKELNGEELGLLRAALVSGKELAEGKTVGQLIREQKSVREEAEAKEKEARRSVEEARTKQAEIVAQLLQLTVLPYKKSLHKADASRADYEDWINITFVFENKGAKDIRAFKGRTTFTDLFGSQIYSTDLVYNQGIKAGATKQWVESIKYNQLVPEQQKLNDTDLESMKFEWKPQAIIFTDGSTLELEEH